MQSLIMGQFRGTKYEGKICNNTFLEDATPVRIHGLADIYIYDDEMAIYPNRGRNRRCAVCRIPYGDLQDPDCDPQVVIDQVMEVICQLEIGYMEKELIS
jgi:hypothetical protein